MSVFQQSYMVDAQATFHITENPAFHVRKKHVKAYYHFIMELPANPILHDCQGSWKNQAPEAVMQAGHD